MNEEFVRRRKPLKEELPAMSKLLTVQLFCALLIILTLFLVSRSSGGISKNIKSFYKDLQKTDMSVSEVVSTLKTTAKETFAPIENIENEKETGESEKTSPDFYYAD